MYQLRCVFVLLFTAISTVLLPGYVSADQASKQYAQLGKTIWAHYQCSIAAEHKNDVEAQKAHSELALAIGRKFWQAAIDGKVQANDFRSTVPVGVSLVIRGPSADFFLGRVYEGVAEHYFKKLEETDSELWLEDWFKESRARAWYGEWNCSLLLD